MHIYVYKDGKITAKTKSYYGIVDLFRGLRPRFTPRRKVRSVKYKGHVTAASVAAAVGAVSCMHAASDCLST